MRQWPVSFRVFLLSALFVLALCGQALAEGRTALVIGNGAYPTAPLKNPVNDATDMAAALTRLGFRVTLLKNATMQQMEEAVREFGLALRKGGIGLFYFAGHGVQVAGENYLVPVNAVIQSEGDVKYGCLNAGLVLAKMEDAGNGPNVVVLDACRNNPFARSFRSAEAGLARMDAPTGSLIAYATAPGKVASDGEGRNGLYTQHLLRNIATPGLSISDLFMNVREGVVRDSGKKQVPWENTSLIGRFSLAGQPVALAPVPQAAPAPKPAPQAAPAPAPAAPPKVAQAGVPAPTPEEEKLLVALREEWGLWKDPERVRRLARPLASEGSIYGTFAMDAMAEEVASRLQAAARAAKQGVPVAMYFHGAYLVARPVGPEDEVAGREWLRKAASLGETGAKVELGAMLMQGKGGPRDVAGGERLLQEAVRENPQESLKIYYLYSVLGNEGVIPKADGRAKAIGYARRAADLGNVQAMLELGYTYSEMEKGQDALFWYTQAASKGSPHGMYQLGVLYHYGLEGGPDQNEAEAARWYRKASGLGHRLSTVRLALMTLAGQGVPKDQAGGLAMLKGLADAGYAEAQVELGRQYQEGLLIPKDVPQAYYWYVVADNAGAAMGGIWRKKLSPQLSAETRASVEARAAKWKPKGGKAVN